MTMTAPVNDSIFFAALRRCRDKFAALKRYFPETETIGDTPELDEVLSEKPPRPLRHTLHFVAALFVTLIAIASFTSVDIVVVATGRLVQFANYRHSANVAGYHSRNPRQAWRAGAKG